MGRPTCPCITCLSAAHPPDQDGEARAWVLHDAAVLRGVDDTLELLAELEMIEDAEWRARLAAC